jgi:hypothetical protein
VKGVSNTTDNGIGVYGEATSAPRDATLSKGGISFYRKPAANWLKIRVKYPDGTLKTGSIALT